MEQGALGGDRAANQSSDSRDVAPVIAVGLDSDHGGKVVVERQPTHAADANPDPDAVAGSPAQTPPPPSHHSGTSGTDAADQDQAATGTGAGSHPTGAQQAAENRSDESPA